MLWTDWFRAFFVVNLATAAAAVVVISATAAEYEDQDNDANPLAAASAKIKTTHCSFLLSAFINSLFKVKKCVTDNRQGIQIKSEKK